MEKILHRGFRYETVPANYVFPPEARQKKLENNKSIPVIDMAADGCDLEEIAKQIFEAGKEFGIFQVVNHGVPHELMMGMMSVMKEFFELPAEERAALCSDDLYKPVRVFTSTGVHDVVGFWRDCLRMAIYPVEEFKQYWPEKPTNLKDIVERYANELKGLKDRVLELTAKGLGLELDYFHGDKSGEPLVSHVNFYPPCPDPSVTLGLAKHCDPGLLTFLLQGEVSGLQIFHNEDWVAVDPIPNAIVINYGHQMEIISNGLLKGVEHRAITNEKQSRLSIANFIQPAKESLIAPAPALVCEENPAIYKPFLFRDYFAKYVTNLGDKEKSEKAFLLEGDGI
ncbi:2'-deoxymugineic-acid 2'-dioxygenase [Apostasia shenzhenica]|uniref:2'-deoxymugineic-acid 2'-dioxygenase n=1 Tax=Apostasia shenzhenica TaxID=1088818 RepID=A0A2H9ZWE0_9ASPA|nr:2'-deoxymugineic-acid 2'-dioxygenase [Apostasia shenzhenica]